MEGDIKSNEPKFKDNLPKDFNLASIISSNQIGVKNLLQRGGKESFNIYELNEEFIDINPKNLDSVYSNNIILKIITNNRFYTGSDTNYSNKNNYLVYFINENEFGVKFKNDGSGIYKNLKELYNKNKISSSYLNLMNTSFYMLLGEDRYSNFKLNEMNNKIKIVDTNIVNYFKNDIKFDNLASFNAKNINLVNENIKAKLVLCGYKEENNIYLKLFDLIRKFNIKNAEGKDYIVRFMPDDINKIKNILIQYLQYEYYDKFELRIHNYNFNDKENFDEIFNSKGEIEKKETKINRIEKNLLSGPKRDEIMLKDKTKRDEIILKDKTTTKKTDKKK